MHSILSTFFQRRGAYKNAFLVRVFLPFSSLGSFTCTAGESTKNKNPAQYLLSVEQMVENDYLIPCGCISKSEGCMEMPQVAADEE